MQDLQYRQEVLPYQKFVIENRSGKEKTEKRKNREEEKQRRGKTMSNTLQEQIEMEEEVRESIKKMYPSDPDHLYRKMALEFYSCDFEKKELTFRWPIQDWELNHMFTMHGGLIAAAIDTTSGALVRSLSKCRITPTTNMNINYLRPGEKADALLVRAKADRVGKHLANIHTECYSEKSGKLLATAMVNFMLIPEK